MKTINYVEYENSYCHRLEPKLNTLRKIAFGVNEVNLPEMRKIVAGIVKDAKWTKKKVSFLKTMNNDIHSKQRLYYFIKNSVNKAFETVVPVEQ